MQIMKTLRQNILICHFSMCKPHQYAVWNKTAHR